MNMLFQFVGGFQMENLPYTTCGVGGIHTHEVEKRKLRIGLLIDSLIQPGWIHRIIEEIEKSDFAEIALIATKESDHHAGRFLDPCRLMGIHFLDFVLENRQALPLLLSGSFPTIGFKPLQQRYGVFFSIRPMAVNGSYHLKEEDLQRIRSEKVDLILNFWGTRIARAAGIAKHGIWSGTPSNSSVRHGEPPCFWEVMNKDSHNRIYTAGGQVQWRSGKSALSVSDGDRPVVREWHNKQAVLEIRGFYREIN